MAQHDAIDEEVMKRITVLKKLGQGAYGHVFKVRCKADLKDIYALKKIFSAYQHATDAQRTFRQISILSKLSHPNIIKLIEVLPSSSSMDIYLLFEYMPSDLHNSIYSGKLTLPMIQHISYNLLKGLHYLHTAKLIHRDLKPSNILLDGEGGVKICDFGLVRFVGNHQENQGRMTEGVATRWYRAPQVLLGSKVYDQKADLWSYGCIVAEMLIGAPLLAGNSTLQQLEKILQLTGKPSSADLALYQNSPVLTLIKQCTTKTRNFYEFFPNAPPSLVSLLSSLLQFSPKNRLSAVQAMRHPFFKNIHNQSNIVDFEGEITMEANDDVRLTVDEYKKLIEGFINPKKQEQKVKCFSPIGKIPMKKIMESPLLKQNQPQRFSDLKKVRDPSFTRLLETMDRKPNSNTKVQQRDPSDKLKHVNLFEQLIRQNSKGSRNGSKGKDKENLSQNVNVGSLLGKFDKGKAGTFGALKKTTVAHKFNSNPVK